MNQLRRTTVTNPLTKQEYLDLHNRIKEINAAIALCDRESGRDRDVLLNLTTELIQIKNYLTEAARITKLRDEMAKRGLK